MSVRERIDDATRGVREKLAQYHLNTPWEWIAPCVGIAVFAGIIGLAYLSKHRDESPAPVVLSPEQKAKTRLEEADKKADEALEARLKGLEELFDKGRAGSKEFAEDALGWSAKWALLKDLVGADDKAHSRQIAEAFDKHVFSGADLEKAMKAAVDGYFLDVEAIESAMLVQLRADLADGEAGPSALPAHLRDDESFKRQYARIAAETREIARTEAVVAVTRELGSQAAGNLATQVVLRVAQFVAADLGVSAGVLTAGAASGWATFGAGIVGGLILDYIIDAVMKWAGYDPAGEIAGKVRGALGTIEKKLIDGEGGLRAELKRLHAERAKVRAAVVRQIVAEGGAS